MAWFDQEQEVNSWAGLAWLRLRHDPELTEVEALHGLAPGRLRVAHELIRNFPENITHDFM